jgi:hypothetical protein
MSKWGYALLIGYAALGLCSLRWYKAMRLGTLMTIALIAYAVHSYGAL